MTAICSRMNVTRIQWLTAIVVGSGLSIGMWWGLACGGGLVGGDTYTYFMPQKVVLAEAFANGEIPLWHNLTGLGYPLHAESQAGVFYPSNQILYRLFDINTAYNTSILLHYALAFVFAWRFVRCQKVSQWPALLAATVYVYGWFPARISLEWSIIGGMWLPLCLWLTDRLLHQPSWRRFAILALCLGTQLLAGHLTLAFICQLTIVAYAALKLFFFRGYVDKSSENASAALQPLPITKGVGVVVASVVAGLLLASVQLLPTYELKKMSQREGGETEFNPAYGHMPPVYITQLFASWWYWHTPEIVASHQMKRTPGAIDADTNEVEAHLYFGLLPFVLLCNLARSSIRDGLDSAVLKTWAVLSGAAIVYATGWLMPVTRHLPGFSFFMGPGRYTIVTALGGSILVASVLDVIMQRSSSSLKMIAAFALGAITLADVDSSSKAITNAVVVQHPPITLVSESWLREALSEEDAASVRLLAPGPNVCNLLGVSCVPQYLGIGPAVYYSDELRPPTGPADANEVFPSEHLATQLESLGVTHVLTLDRLENPSDDVELIHGFPDTILNTVWGRQSASCFLYRLKSTPRRIAVDPTAAFSDFEVTHAGGTRVAFNVDLKSQAIVTWRELMYPGWQVAIDGHRAEPIDTTMRAVAVDAGHHSIEWVYRPLSFRLGAMMSGAIFFALLAMVSRGRERSSGLKTNDHED